MKMDRAGELVYRRGVEFRGKMIENDRFQIWLKDFDHFRAASTLSHHYAPPRSPLLLIISLAVIYGDAYSMDPSRQHVIRSKS
jgi:hypothetical protein